MLQILGHGITSGKAIALHTSLKIECSIAWWTWLKIATSVASPDRESARLWLSSIHSSLLAASRSANRWCTVDSSYLPLTYLLLPVPSSWRKVGGTNLRFAPTSFNRISWSSTVAGRLTGYLDCNFLEIFSISLSVSGDSKSWYLRGGHQVWITFLRY